MFVSLDATIELVYSSIPYPAEWNLSSCACAGSIRAADETDAT